MTGRTVAVTGGSGFLGRHTVKALAVAGWSVRALLRRPSEASGWGDEAVTVVPGALDQPEALANLVRGADVVVHLAGLIKAHDDQAFLRVNRDGTAALCAALRAQAPNAHLLLVSSLAARAPDLSGYAMSKRAGEQVALAQLGPDRLSVLRPPAIYGPGDRETLIFFQLGAARVIPLIRRPRARLALIHVEDAARALAVRAAGHPSGRIQALSDGCPEGYSWRQILEAAAAAVDNSRPRFLPVAPGVLKVAGATVGGVARVLGRPAMVNAGKIRELLHEDWAVSVSERCLEPGAEPRFGLVDGFQATAGWYRQAQWL